MDDFIGGNNYDKTQEQLKTKKLMKIIIVLLVILLIASIGLTAYIFYLKSEELKISIDGVSNSKTTSNLKQILQIADGKIYIPIRAFASYVGYESGNGGYKQYSEDNTKCYVQSESEVATFSLGSNKIYKILLDGSSDTEYYEIDEPIQAINGQLYTTMEGARIAFNISMDYNQETNTIRICTLPYLVSYYGKQFGYNENTGKDMSFSNQKAILYGMIVQKNSDNNYGVYDFVNKKEVLGTKYSDIKFIESTKEFVVTTVENKMGIMLYDSSTKINPQYDSIKQIDKDTELYLVTNNQKFGVINGKGNIVIYLEYDKIGIDNAEYANEIDNQYLLYNKYIPVCRDKKWDLFDITGRKITARQYDGLGCNVVNKEQSGEAKPVLLITKYEGIVVKYGDFYGVINGEGNELVSPVVQNIYSVTSGDYTTYNMTYNNQTMDILAYIQEVLNRQNNQASNVESTQTNNTENNQNDLQNNNEAANTTQNPNDEITSQTNANTLDSNNIVQQ